MRKLGETDVFDKTIALRVDLNVPIEDGKVLDDTRILAIIPTLKYLLDKKAKVVFTGVKSVLWGVGCELDAPLLSKISWYPGCRLPNSFVCVWVGASCLSRSWCPRNATNTTNTTTNITISTSTALTST